MTAILVLHGPNLNLTGEREQAAVSAFSLHALACTSLDALLHEGARVVTAVLGVEHCEVLEWDAAANLLHLRAAVGWKPGQRDAAVVRAAPRRVQGQPGQQDPGLPAVIVRRGGELLVRLHRADHGGIRLCQEHERSFAGDPSDLQ